VNTSRLMGGALGLAILTALATSHTNGLVDGGPETPGALVDGYHLAFTVAAGFALAGALVALIVLQQQKPRRAAPVPAEIAG
jgi:hypothetical protein